MTTPVPVTELGTHPPPCQLTNGPRTHPHRARRSLPPAGGFDASGRWRPMPAWATDPDPGRDDTVDR